MKEQSGSPIFQIDLWSAAIAEQIALYKVDSKNYRKNVITQYFVFLKDLLNNPELDEHVNLDDNFSSKIVDLQNGLNEIGLSKTVDPLKCLVSLHVRRSKNYKALGSFLDDICFMLKAAQGDDELLKIILSTDGAGRILLRLAVYWGKEEVVNMLLELAKRNIVSLRDLLVPDEEGKTLLHLAAISKYKEIVFMLIDAAKGDEELLESLVGPLDGCSDLFEWAATEGQTEIVVAILKLCIREIGNFHDKDVSPDDQNIIQKTRTIIEGQKAIIECQQKIELSTKNPELIRVELLLLFNKLQEIDANRSNLSLFSTAASTASTEVAKVSIPKSVTQQAARSEPNQVGNSLF